MNVREGLLRRRIDPALTPHALSRIASAALETDIEVSGWEPLTGGCWNRVIRLTGGRGADGVVLKISPSLGDAGLKRESIVLSWFTEHTTMPVPRTLRLDDTGSLVPGTVLAMSRIAGAPLHAAFRGLGEEDRRRVTTSIAEDLAELHRRTATGFGGVELPPSSRVDWPSFWLPRFDAVMDEVRGTGLVDPRFLARIERLRPALPALLDIGERSTLTHYDIWSGNIMVDDADGSIRVSGYLDVPGYWADPVRELSFAEMFGIADPLFHRVYGSVHRLPEGWQLRRDLYNLKMHLKHVTMYPGDPYYRHGAARCLAALEASLGPG